MRRPDTEPILPEGAAVTGILAGKVAVVRSGDARWLAANSDSVIELRRKGGAGGWAGIGA